MDEVIADPWPPGLPIRLAKPDNRKHPYTGCEGVVLKARWFEPVYKLRKGSITDAAPEVLRPGCWLVRVKLEPGPGVEEKWKRQAEWLLFERELERVE